MLAGNITVNVAGGVMTIDGDAAANIFTLTPNAGDVRVTGAATTINGAAGPTDFAGVTSVIMNLGAEADNVTVQNLTLTTLTINGEAGADTILVNTTMNVTGVATLDGGTEADNLTFSNSTSGTLQIFGDTGNDAITASTVTATTLLISGEQNEDDILVTGLTNTVVGTLNVNGNDGNDIIDFLASNGTLASPLTIDGNAGNDTLRVNNVTVGVLDVDAGSGDDNIILGIDNLPDINSVAGLNNAIAEGSLTVNTTLTVSGDVGNDTISAYRVFGTADWTVDTGAVNNLTTNTDIFTTYWTVSDQLTVIGGAGVDRLNIFYHTSNGVASVTGAAGDDVLQILISHFLVNANFFGENGNDVLAADTNLFDLDLFINGGQGDDVLIVAASVVIGDMTIFGDSGADYGLIGRHANGSAGGNLVENGLLDIDTGTGVDNFNISFNSLLQFYANLGDDNDSVETGFNLILIPSFMDGGFGINAIRRTSPQNITFYNLFS
jgi:hypothetical protein